MRLLLDTHALLWWWFDDGRLSGRAAALIAEPDNTVFVSAASVWEISTKYRLGKLDEAADAVQRFDELMGASRFEDLPIARAHAMKAGAFEHAHRDPFDRMLAAQSIVEGLPILTADSMIKALGAEVIW